MPEILAPLLVKGKPFPPASVAKTVRASCGDSYLGDNRGKYDKRPIDAGLVPGVGYDEAFEARKAAPSIGHGPASINISSITPSSSGPPAYSSHHFTPMRCVRM